VFLFVFEPCNGPWLVCGLRLAPPLCLLRLDGHPGKCIRCRTKVWGGRRPISENLSGGYTARYGVRRRFFESWAQIRSPSFLIVATSAFDGRRRTFCKTHRQWAPSSEYDCARRSIRPSFGGRGFAGSQRKDSDQSLLSLEECGGAHLDLIDR